MMISPPQANRTELFGFSIMVRTDETCIRYPAIAASSADAIMHATDIFGAAIITATPIEARHD